MGTLQKVIAIRNKLHWANKAPWDHGNPNSMSPAKLWSALKENSLSKGIICGAQAKVLKWLYNKKGLEASVVSLIGMGEKHLTHAAVDVKVDGKWIMMDPYFNCSFVQRGSLIKLSSHEIAATIQSRKTVIVKFDSCFLNWVPAWKAYQKSLQWIVQMALNADDIQLTPVDKAFFTYTWPWVKTGSPDIKEYNWKKRQYSYWEYFYNVRGGH